MNLNLKWVDARQKTYSLQLNDKLIQFTIVIFELKYEGFVIIYDSAL